MQSCCPHDRQRAQIIQIGFSGQITEGNFPTNSWLVRKGVQQGAGLGFSPKEGAWELAGSRDDCGHNQQNWASAEKNCLAGQLMVRFPATYVPSSMAFLVFTHLSVFGRNFGARTTSKTGVKMVYGGFVEAVDMIESAVIQPITRPTNALLREV